MRVSPFGHPRINGYLPLPAAFRSLSRPSSAPGAEASAPRDFRIYIPKNTLRSFVAKAFRKDEEPTALLNEFFNDYFIGEL